MYASIKLPGLEVANTILKPKTGWDGGKTTVLAVHPKMQMRESAISCISGYANQLTFFNRISHIYESTLFLQMPVTTKGTITMKNYDMIAIAEVFITDSSPVRIFFYFSHYSF